MQRNLTTLLFGAAATLSAGTALADDASDAPIATAPPSETESLWEADQVVSSVIETTEEVEVGEPTLSTYAPPEIGCVPTAEFGIGQGRIDDVLGFDVADGEPTALGEASRTCGDVTIASSAAFIISPEPDRGARRLADEVRFDFVYHPEVATRFGRFSLLGGVAYRFEDHGKGLFSISDDYTELMIGLSHRFSLGSYELTSWIKNRKPNPVDNANSLNVITNGIQLAGPAPGNNRFAAGIEQIHNVNSLYATPHRNVTIGSVEWMRRVGESDWVGVLTVAASQYGKRDEHQDKVVERDGRVLMTSRNELNPGPWLVPKIALSFRWMPRVNWRRW